jgi:oligopeptidase A
MTNPLLNFCTDPSQLPAFNDIRPEHLTPALDEVLTQANAALQTVTAANFPADYMALSKVLDTALERLGRVWGSVTHLHSVMDTPELRSVYTHNLPRITEFNTRLGSDEKLYAKYKAVLHSTQTPPLNPAQTRALENAVRDFVLSGAELEGTAKMRFAEIQDRQAHLSQHFSEHVMDATDGYAYYAQADELAGVPEDAKEAARQAAQADGKDGFKITLHFPSYFPVMQYGENRALRETLYRATTTRASEIGKPEWDNSAIMTELLALRQEEAKLLGYANFAEVSVVPKMADSPQQVIDFLRDLGQRAKPYAQRDLNELKAFAADELALPDLQAWDVAFASEKLKEARYTFSDQEVKQYFTEPKVLQGLFDIVQTLFEVTIRPEEAKVWHPSVRFYRIERQGQLIGQFYLDPYARSGKRPGAWMDDVRSRWMRPEGGLQTPVAHLVCNYTPPLSGQSALLTHDDVTTLFHEFGHGLHHMLTQVNDLGVSGISGVEWDAVELPSQFMENFCWEWDVIQRLTAHVKTGESLPRALFDKMLAAKNFQSGMQTVRQVELALFDMRLHVEPKSATQIQQVIDEVRQEVAVLVPPAFNRFQHSFSHIFAGGYSAGYYSYKWAEVLSADAWSAFEETATLEQPISVETGRNYRTHILEVGGSRPAMESFKAFRGREPKIDALLRHQGMAQ